MYGTVGANSAQTALPTYVSFTPVVVVWLALVALRRLPDHGSPGVTLDVPNGECKL